MAFARRAALPVALAMALSGCAIDAPEAIGGPSAYDASDSPADENGAVRVEAVRDDELSLAGAGMSTENVERVGRQRSEAGAPPVDVVRRTLIVEPAVTVDEDGPVGAIGDDGRLRGRAYALNDGEPAFEAGVVCLRNLSQVDCSDTARTWQVRLKPGRFAAMQFAVEAEQGDRFDFLFQVKEDWKQPLPASGRLQVFAGVRAMEHPEPAGPAGARLGRAVLSEGFAGCAVTGIVSQSEPDEVLRGEVDSAEGLAVVVDLCPEYGTLVVLAGVMVGGHTFVELSETGLPLVAGEGFLLPLPALPDGEEVQPVVLWWQGDAAGSWYGPSLTVP